MEALDIILNSKTSKNIENRLYNELKLYKEYLLLIKKLSRNEQRSFLKTLKYKEILNNHEMEHEDQFLCELELQLELNGRKKTSIDIIRSNILKNKKMNLNNLIKLHRVLIRGTNDDLEKNYKIRKTDVRVSYIENNKEHIQYVPPKGEEIEDYLIELFNYMADYSNINEIDILKKSFIEHFYISALQPFNNGNTRLARLIQYGEIFNLTRRVYDIDIDSPTIYMSKNYLLTGDNYRNKIAKLVQNPCQDNIDKWFEYNLNAVDEQIFFCQNNIKKGVKKN